MNVFIIFVLGALLLGNLLTMYQLNEKMERVEQTLVDMDIIYLKLQQFFRM